MSKRNVDGLTREARSLKEYAKYARMIRFQRRDAFDVAFDSTCESVLNDLASQSNEQLQAHILTLVELLIQFEIHHVHQGFAPMRAREESREVRAERAKKGTKDRHAKARERAKKFCKAIDALKKSDPGLTDYAAVALHLERLGELKKYTRVKQIRAGLERLKRAREMCARE